MVWRMYGMSMPKGWDKPEKVLKLYNEDEVWELVTKAITRLMYDMIATYEAHGKDTIPVDWIRDYTDDIAVNFPRVQE